MAREMEFLRDLDPGNFLERIWAKSDHIWKMSMRSEVEQGVTGRKIEMKQGIVLTFTPKIPALFCEKRIGSMIGGQSFKVPRCRILPKAEVLHRGSTIANLICKFSFLRLRTRVRILSQIQIGDG